MTTVATPESRWWQQPVRFFQHLLREVDAVGLDPTALIEEVRAMGAGAYIVMGGGFSAWYPTTLASQRINPHLSGDFLGDTIAAAGRVGIKTIVRMDISKGQPELLAANPDWFTYNQDGLPNLIWEMPQTCATGPFWQVETFAILDELLARYPADGFFFNFLNVGRCYCSRCKAEVRAATGADVPLAGVRTPAYERWRQLFLASYMKRVRECIRARSPEAVLIPYHHVRDGWSYRLMAEAGDIVSAQVSNPLAVNPVDPQPQWNHWAAEEALASRAVKLGVPPILVQTGSEFFASRQTAIPADRMIRNLIQIAAHGGNTTPSLNGRLKQDDPRTIPHLLEFARYQKANTEWYKDLKSVARVAVIRSQDSMDWGPDAGRPAGDPRNCGHVAEFRGIYEILVQLRYPGDVLIADNLQISQLEKYGVVILPAVSCLSMGDAAALDAYVAAGGTLIATADVAANNQDGEPRNTPALACLPYLPGSPHNVFGGYFKLVDADLRKAFGNIPHIGADGDFWSPAGAERMNADLRLIGPFRNNAPEFTVVQGSGAEPGLLGSAYGKGRASWLTWRPGALHHFSAIPEYVTLFGYLLKRAVGDPAIRSDASCAVEFILYSHPRGQVLHLLNGAAMQTKPLVETVPLAGFTVRIRGNADRAIQLNTGAWLPLERDGADAVIRLERLDTFAVVVLLHATTS